MPPHHKDAAFSPGSVCCIIALLLLCHRHDGTATILPVDGFRVAVISPGLLQECRRRASTARFGVTTSSSSSHSSSDVAEAATTESSVMKSAVAARVARPAGTSRALGDFERIQIAGEESSSFMDSMGVATFRCTGGVWEYDEPTSDESVAAAAASAAVAYRTVPGALFEDNHHTPTFCLGNVLSKADCDDIIQACEESDGFRLFRAGKNHHGAMQLLVSDTTVETVAARIRSHINIEAVEARRCELERHLQQQQQQQQQSHPQSGDTVQSELNDAPTISTMVSTTSTTRLVYAGLNRRWRVYKYAPNAVETFAPHIDAGFPPSGLTEDKSAMIYDISDASRTINSDDETSHSTNIVSRLTILFYLNDDFVGGETNFYQPQSTVGASPQFVLASSVQPVAGSCLIFPQCVGVDAMDYARQYWPLHEGSPVQSGAAKYVIRSDILFTEVPV